MPLPLTRRELLKLGLAAGLTPAARWAPTAPGPWSFAFWSDSHVQRERNGPVCRALVTEIAERIRPAFAVNGGDVTEFGWAAEYDRYARVLAGLPFPVHHVPGNHDVRWAPRGLQIFRERLGPPHRSFRHRGCHFALLDSTVPLSHWGHLESAQLRWLAGELRRVGRQIPVFLFTHHWVGRPNGVDNERALWNVIEPFNVRLIFTGHGHSDLLWEWNGVACTMNRGLYQGSYQSTEIDAAADEVRLSRRTVEEPTLRPIATIPLRAPAGPRRVWAPEGAAEAVPVGTELHRRWARRLGAGVFSHLCLRDGVLYVSAMDGSVHALRAADGAALWTARTGGACHSSPVPDGERVIVGSADGTVYALDARTGRTVWQRPTGGPVYATAAVAGGIAAIASGDGSVYGLEMGDGRARWRFRLPPSPSAFAQSAATTDGERFFVGAWDRHVYALDVATGEPVWRRQATPKSFAYSPAIGSPAVGGGTVFVPSNDNVLHALDAATGQPRWRYTSPGDKVGYSSPALVDGRIFIGCLGDRGEIRCIDADAGHELWTAATGSTIYDSSPAIADGHVGIGSVDGTLWLLAADTGRIVGQHRLPPGLLLASPAAGNRSVYAASYGDTAVALDLPG